MRTSLFGLSEQEIWDICSMLSDVEFIFRTLKGGTGFKIFTEMNHWLMAIFLSEKTHNETYKALIQNVA